MQGSFHKYIGGYGLVATGAKITIECHSPKTPKLWTIKIEKNGKILEVLKSTEPRRAYEIFENVNAEVVELMEIRKRLKLSIADMLSGKKK